MPPAMMASPSLLLGSLRCSPWPSSGQRGSAFAASGRHTCGGAESRAQVAQSHERMPPAQH
eukprot:10814859-Alexandrium_andersonii.AAC.1